MKQQTIFSPPQVPQAKAWLVLENGEEVCVKLEKKIVLNWTKVVKSLLSKSDQETMESTLVLIRKCKMAKVVFLK